MENPNQVEVKLLHYTFVFKRLVWREELAIKLPPQYNPQRAVLACALISVSGLKVPNEAEARRVLDAVPIAIVERVFRIWKGTFPPSRHFTASRLYRAPEPATYNRKMDEGSVFYSEESPEDREITSKFGSEQLADSKNIQRKILEGARTRDGGYRGAIPTTDKKGSL